MRNIRFGGTGLQVSRLCMGTMTFGLQCDEPESVAILNAAAEGGINFLDTADGYPLGGSLDTVGRTEEIIGRWLRGRRHQFVIATKCFAPMGPEPWNRGNSRKHILDAVDASLRRLGTDYIDLYQLHQYDANTPIDESLEALDVLVKHGKVRYIGCSNFQAWRLARALGRGEFLRTAKFVSVQPRYNLLFRQIERELLPLCAEERIAVIPYNPLAGGLLTAKHDRDNGPTAGTRFTLGRSAKLYTDRYWKEHEFETVGRFAALAKEAGVDPATLAVAWVMANPAITSPIIGASRPEQLRASLAASDYVLDPALKVTLDELSHEYRMGDSER